ncbi:MULTISPECIES: DUF397 domain-containing protein [Streptomyces]|uniref:DUF397 domain-containing protein n=1 Tax=Streptomyces TaxID=1883 RepID=UPI000995F286|nr:MULTISPECIES: DUF397 domain-containing protein [Streptomyces]
MENRAWIRPSACSNASNCPEVSVTSDTVYVRSSLRPEAIAQLDVSEWRDLVSAIRAGEFDV